MKAKNIKVGDEYFMKVKVLGPIDEDGIIEIRYRDRDGDYETDLVKSDILHPIPKQQESPALQALETATARAELYMDPKKRVEDIEQRLTKLEPAPEPEIEVGDLVEVVGGASEGARFIVKNIHHVAGRTHYVDWNGFGFASWRLKLIRKAADL